ncbi:MAG TPA: galactokinase family protein [Clostridia bacterium]|jgi:N-acetylgalactosamine kinase|nr:galactokinase family protein [Clostridia bacterium]HQC68705.1 galactokinase family protein [Clostridia bacterium]
MNPVAILLCAGKGTRMKDTSTHKVCYEIAGIPAIVRSIDNFKKAGINRFVVVVGSQADKVMSCLDGIEGIVFAYQPEQKGTGNAALYGLKAVKELGLSDKAVVAMGDKILSPELIKQLAVNNASKATFIVQPVKDNESGGRIAVRDNKVYGIIEQLDVALLRLGELRNQSRGKIAEKLSLFEIPDKKKEILLKRTLDILEHKGKLPAYIELGNTTFTAGQLESSGLVNGGTYLFDVDAALEAISNISSNNAQNEIYLTDAINYLASKYSVNTIVCEDKNKMLTYNTMDDLIKLQQFFIPVKTKKVFTNAKTWLEKIENWTEDIKAKFENIYGKEDNNYLEDRKQTYINLLKTFIDKYGDKPVVIAHAPGRVNIMGRHIDHRGGNINVMSISKETVVVASPRDDDIVNISNTDIMFKDYSFSISDTLKMVDTHNWIEFIEHKNISDMVMQTRGEWVNYVKAATLRLQLKNTNVMLCGMDMMYTGNIPIAAGLSSSSSIVVASTEAAIALNDLDIQIMDFINLCGEGEWFVGSRGGAGDHAAMKCGKYNMLTHIGFMPFEIKGTVPFPKGCSLIVANSYVEAKKSAGSRDQFNQKVACYEFGLMMIKKLFPQYAHKLNYLRDINTRNLSVTQSRIYEMLLALPEHMTSDEVHEQLSEHKEKIDRIQKSHKIPEFYEVRSVVLYGIAECERANRSYELLKNGDYMTLGKLMNISHDGDRVWKDNNPYDYSASDLYLKSLISDLSSEVPERVERAQIYNQPGGYACSTKVIDDLVDYVNQQEGVLGSELSGAGLGGCILILVKKEKANNILDLLKKHYYDKNNLPMGAEIFKPVSGSSVFN